MSFDFGGSNPPLSTVSNSIRLGESSVSLAGRAGSAETIGTTQAGVAQLVEHQPSKLRVAGSNPVSRSITQLAFFNNATRRFSLSRVAHVAQLVEHFLGKEEVTGSIPVVGSINSVPGTGRA